MFHRPTWTLRSREPVAKKYGGSGQDDFWAVRIVWSEKLGLHLECGSEAQAKHMVSVIKRAGKIRPEYWQRYFLGDPAERRRWNMVHAD